MVCLPVSKSLVSRATVLLLPLSCRLVLAWCIVMKHYHCISLSESSWHKLCSLSLLVMNMSSTYLIFLVTRCYLVKQFLHKLLCCHFQLPYYDLLQTCQMLVAVFLDPSTNHIFNLIDSIINLLVKVKGVTRINNFARQSKKPQVLVSRRTRKIS